MEEAFEESKKIKFNCSNCGLLSRDDVIFLCNKCNQVDMIYKEGFYMCPSCLEKGENFECIKCGSKEVVMDIKN